MGSYFHLATRHLRHQFVPHVFGVRRKLGIQEQSVHSAAVRGTGYRIFETGQRDAGAALCTRRKAGGGKRVQADMQRESKVAEAGGYQTKNLQGKRGVVERQ